MNKPFVMVDIDPNGTGARVFGIFRTVDEAVPYKTTNRQLWTKEELMIKCFNEYRRVFGSGSIGLGEFNSAYFS